jgi:hypothetical protein
MLSAVKNLVQLNEILRVAQDGRRNAQDNKHTVMLSRYCYIEQSKTFREIK